MYSLRHHLPQTLTQILSLNLLNFPQMLNSFGTTHRFLVQNLITKHKFSNTIPQSIVVIFHFIVIFQLIFVALDFSVEGGGVVYFLDWGL